MTWKSLSLSALSCLMFLGGPSQDTARAQTIDLSAARIVDLTHPFDKGTLYWPTSPTGFELKPVHKGPTPLGFYYAAYSFCAPEHGGTHLDASAHFVEGVWTSGEIPVERFIGSAVVIDVSEKARTNPHHQNRGCRGVRSRARPATVLLARAGAPAGRTASPISATTRRGTPRSCISRPSGSRPRRF
jgi:hypothetical protein